MDYEALSHCPLFAHIGAEELPGVVRSLSPVTREYAKNQTIIMQGDPPPGIGLLTAGAALVVTEDYWGRRSIVTSLTAGEMFAEAFDCAGLPESPVTVTSTAESRALFFRHETLLEGARTDARLQNVCEILLRIVARKNLALLRLNGLLSRRTIRERALGYLSHRAQEEQARSFSIPMNRQEMADYLAVDRSALSAELSRLKGEGLIDFRKNHFTLQENRVHSE